MTSEQINAEGPHSIDPVVMDLVMWLKEIAYQLAVMNERLASDKTAIQVALCATNDDIPVRIMS